MCTRVLRMRIFFCNFAPEIDKYAKNDKNIVK